MQNVYDAKQLMTMYQRINSRIRKTSDPGDLQALETVRQELQDYIATPNKTLYGDQGALDQFQTATRTAAEHYSRFHPNRFINRYIDTYKRTDAAGTPEEFKLTDSDLSRRIFSSAALDFTEAAKADTLHTLLRAVPNGERWLKNEAFANLTEKDTIRSFRDAQENIRKRFVAGDESATYGMLFSPEEKSKMAQLVGAADAIDVKGTTPQGTLGATLRTSAGSFIPDMFKIHPKYFRMARHEGNILGTSTQLGRIFAKSAVRDKQMEQRREEGEDEPWYIEEDFFGIGSR